MYRYTCKVVQQTTVSAAPKVGMTPKNRPPVRHYHRKMRCFGVPIRFYDYDEPLELIGMCVPAFPLLPL